MKFLGAGYSPRRVGVPISFATLQVRNHVSNNGAQVETGKSEGFSIPSHGLRDGVPPNLSVDPYTAAWRIEIVRGKAHWGFECLITPEVSNNIRTRRSQYVSVCRGTTNFVWDLDDAGYSVGCTKVGYHSPTSMG